MTAPFHVIFALYPRVTQLDFTGPYEVLTRIPGAQATLASMDGGTMEADGGITFSGLKAFKDIKSCDLICVPGGFGTFAMIQDQPFLAEIKRLADQSRYVTSVCTGSLILAAAGLLTGKNAACHWAWRDQLSQFGAIPNPARVVRDGNIMTGGGVTAGIDMALTMLAEIAGADYAQAVQLGLEYAPAPPFNSGRPETAPAHILERVQQMYAAR